MKSKSLTRFSQKGWLTIITCCFLAIGSLDAQSITWAIVNAAGYTDGTDGSLRWTIGEPMTTETTGETGTLRMGFLPFVFTEEITSATMIINPDIAISISPNPAADQIHVQVPGEDHYLVRIISLDGRSKIASDITSEMQVDIQSLPAGAYVLYVIASNGTYNSKTFVKS